MGSLTSGPSVPSSQVVFVPQSVNHSTTTTTTTTTTTAGANNTATQADNDAQSTQEQADQEARRQSLLGRERSRFGTIQTSFRGLLGLANSGVDSGGDQPRKTLLGQ